MNEEIEQNIERPKYREAERTGGYKQRAIDKIPLFFVVIFTQKQNKIHTKNIISYGIVLHPIFLSYKCVSGLRSFAE